MNEETQNNQENLEATNPAETNPLEEATNPADKLQDLEGDQNPNLEEKPSEEITSPPSPLNGDGENTFTPSTSEQETVTSSEKVSSAESVASILDEEEADDAPAAIIQNRKLRRELTETRETFANYKKGAVSKQVHEDLLSKYQNVCKEKRNLVTENEQLKNQGKDLEQN